MNEKSKSNIKNLNIEISLYKMKIMNLKKWVDEYLSDSVNIENRIKIFGEKEPIHFKLANPKEEIEKLSIKEIMDLLLVIQKELSDCEWGLSELSEIKITDVYTLTRDINTKTYNLFKSLKKEYPHLDDEFILNHLGYSDEVKPDKNLIDEIKKLKEKEKPLNDIKIKLKKLEKLVYLILNEKKQDELMSGKSTKEEEFLVVYEEEFWENNLVNSTFKGVTTKKEFEYLRENKIAFVDYGKHGYSIDFDRKYVLKEPKTLEELNLVAKYLKKLKKHTFIDELGILTIPMEPDIKITKRELLENGLFYLSEHNWKFLRKIRNKNMAVTQTQEKINFLKQISNKLKLEDPETKEDKKRNI